ncbi:hypothetical protein V512_006370 [Mesotoga sp. Brook.08.105.5.1]|nr:hypothetical protein [Mesotoga sp. Brook.08.105.5.1]PVD16548.1 hypothetical protein V512_006370 [Mesotoga sp. Brook.08.105.5.1]
MTDRALRVCYFGKQCSWNASALQQARKAAAVLDVDLIECNLM